MKQMKIRTKLKRTSKRLRKKEIKRNKLDEKISKEYDKKRELVIDLIFKDKEILKKAGEWKTDIYGSNEGIISIIPKYHCDILKPLKEKGYLNKNDYWHIFNAIEGKEGVFIRDDIQSPTIFFYSWQKLKEFSDEYDLEICNEKTIRDIEKYGKHWIKAIEGIKLFGDKINLEEEEK